jgi:hypothetical protein
MNKNPSFAGTQTREKLFRSWKFWKQILGGIVEETGASLLRKWKAQACI